MPTSGSVGTVRLGATADYRPTRTDSAAPKPRPFDWGYGVNMVANAGTTSQLILQEAYVKGRFHQIELYAGRRRNIIGLMDTTLSSGAYAWSGNALPIPVIQIGTIGYAPVKFTRGLIAINAIFNHGWFTDGFVQNSYLHQKTLYGRLGKPNWRVKLYGGISHQVQWSGYAPGLGNDPGLSENGYLASGVGSYVNVITSRRGASAYTTNPGVISVDQGNRIGNQLGSVDVAIEFNVSAYNVMIYRQNPYETGALYYLTSIADGLNGIRLQRKQPGTSRFSVDHILFEYFYSKSQGGPEFVIEDPKRRGQTNNFNHSQYQDGWTYLGRTIGTPFLSQRTEVRPNLVSSTIANNRVSLVHVAAAGSVNQRIAWLLKLSYSQNFGTYPSPYPADINQFSGLVQVATPVSIPTLGECQLNASLALDRGQLLYNSAGVYIGLRKTITSQPVDRQRDPTTGSRMLRQ
ncbi:MAG: hypothetical protein H7Z72_10565 [Bacteroidetes bacterium]|nr:hypothetical protein [Fibrella sp.]